MARKSFYFVISNLIANFGFCSEQANIRVENLQYIYSVDQRKPLGIGKSPYPITSLPRYLFNYMSNGYFSSNTMHNACLLPRSGSCIMQSCNNLSNHSNKVKIVFLGDIMLSKSGSFAAINADMVQLLKEADVIVANVEAPVIKESLAIKRGASLKFSMPTTYLKNLYEINPAAQWIFSIANNHACDMSDINNGDISGIEQTVACIKSEMRNAAVIGANVSNSYPGAIVCVKNGLRIGIIAWSDLMNNDSMHYQKPILRGQDIKADAIAKLKHEQKIDYLIGFAHGNEEQSYYPLHETRNGWISLTGREMFDLIVGHGPHVVQPAEKINGGLIFHSIGNFCSPVGRTQTKVGCIPEIVLSCTSEASLTCTHFAHLLQQDEDEISLIKPDFSNAKYPEIVSRIRKIWFDAPFHVIQQRSLFKPILTAGILALAGYAAYKRIFAGKNSATAIS